jgi:hypothetical protein
MRKKENKEGIGKSYSRTIIMRTVCYDHCVLHRQFRQFQAIPSNSIYPKYKEYGEGNGNWFNLKVAEALKNVLEFKNNNEWSGLECLSPNCGPAGGIDICCRNAKGTT